MRKTILTETFSAGAAIPARRIVAASEDEHIVELAGGGTAPLIGVTTEIEAVEGDAVDVHSLGVAEVDAAGAFDFGDPITSDAAGKAILASPAADTNVHIIGYARSEGEDGAIAHVFLAPGVIQGEPAG